MEQPMSTTNEVATSTKTNAPAAQKDTNEGAADSNPRATMYQKSIAYDRETRDYAMRLDGELVGFARTYHEAEVTLDSLVFDLLVGRPFGERIR
jgi:hypothetical protein